MSEQERTEHRAIKAKFTSMDPAILARLRAIAAMQPDALSSDPKILADDLQTIAVLALHTHENVEILIQFLQEMGKVGTMIAERPEEPPKRGRF